MHQFTESSTSTPNSPKSNPNRKRSTYCQTDSLVFITEDSFAYSANCKLRNDIEMRKSYSKAVSYINSCHRFVNVMLERKNHLKIGDLKYDGYVPFELPYISNYSSLFSCLINPRTDVFNNTSSNNNNTNKNKMLLPKTKIPQRKEIVNVAKKPVVPSSIHASHSPKQQNNAIAIGRNNNTISADHHQKSNSNQLATVVKEQIQEYFSNQDECHPQKHQQHNSRKIFSFTCQTMDITSITSEITRNQGDVKAVEVVRSPPPPSPPLLSSSVPPSWAPCHQHNDNNRNGSFFSEDDVRQLNQNLFLSDLRVDTPTCNRLRTPASTCRSIYSDSSDFRSDSELNF